MNKVLLLGQLGADPEGRATNGGMFVLRLRLATTERRKRGEDWVNESEWHNVVVFGNRGESLSKHLSKGDKILVEGKLSTRSWEKDGVKHFSTEILADNVEFAGAPRGGRQQQQALRAQDNRRNRDDDRPLEGEDPGDNFFRS